MTTMARLLQGADSRIYYRYWYLAISPYNLRLYTYNAQEVNNVLVVVTRYFGGIHLGPDRFKHINQAARNALELGGFLDLQEVKKNGRGRRH
jgi:Uncharacterized protein family UPF0029